MVMTAALALVVPRTKSGVRRRRGRSSKHSLHSTDMAHYDTDTDTEANAHRERFSESRVPWGRAMTLANSFAASVCMLA